MVDFASPRFSSFGPGTRLHRILNSVPPNSEHLGNPTSGENGDVAAVQRAFYDLGWTMEIDPQEPDPAEMVTDYFGVKTEAVALAYKTHYDLSTPGVPGYTGTVGPQTLALLDLQCTYYDACANRIDQKAEALNSDGSGVIQLGVQADPGPQPKPVRTTSAVYWEGTYYGYWGHFCDEAETATAVVWGPIYDYWVEEGWITGPLGLPTSDCIDAGDDATYLCDFVGGRITWDYNAGTTSVEYWS